ncbi:condensation domain-containing protein [Streptomyces sp. NRRL WC-3742]|uniref:condensation domain-containing protein n=1 Tax=Streptomyces sp. NRRL WC-3742 TaxID=1463934 RepID=UPI0004CC09B0|nr:condensation domain-containing protein [Streptomyces sp. NRRL WC-3742]
MTVTPLDPDRSAAVEAQVREAVLRHGSVEDCAVVLNGPATGARHCVRCGITAAYPGLTFDTDGVCSLCTHYAAHRQAIHDYFRPPEDLAPTLRAAAEARGSAYDCLLLFSGGKDSSYVLYRLVDLGLRVMTFTFDNGFISRTALRNCLAITEELGVEHITATRADQKAVFLDSLRDHKSVCNGCFRSLLDLSTEVAHTRGIPSIVTGLSRGQIMDERLSWFHERGIFDVAEIEEKLRLGRRAYHSASGAEVDRASLDTVRIVDYFRYSEVTKTDIRAFLRERSDLWSQPVDTGFCSSNCMINDVGVYVHSAERGYHNYEAPTRWEVRLGHLDVAEADEELSGPVDTAQVHRMLATIGYPDPADRDRIGARLSVYYVPRDGTAPARLAAAVAPTLPASLRPAQWIPVDEIPRSGGIVDRWALRSRQRAGISGSRTGSTAEPEESPRRYPLTAGQRALLGGGGGARALVLTLDDTSCGPAELKAVILQLLLHHDALRLRFEESDAGLSQYHEGVGGRLPVATLNLRDRGEAEETELIDRARARLLGALDPAGGRLLRAAVLDRAPRPAGLLLVVHELVADVESWRVLLEDLALGLGQLRAGGVVELPPAGSFPPALGTPRLSDAGDRSTAHRIGACLAEVLSQPVEVVDHTARSRTDRLVAPLPPTPDNARPTVRYEHFGDVAATLTPAGAPWKPTDRSVEEFARPSGGHGQGLTVTGRIHDGELALTWWAEPPLRARLAEERAAQRLDARLRDLEAS